MSSKIKWLEYVYYDVTNSSKKQDYITRVDGKVVKLILFGEEGGNVYPSIDILLYIFGRVL